MREADEVHRHQAELQNWPLSALLKHGGVTDQPLKPHGRRYLPHGHGQEAVYRPHIQHIEPNLTECDLDWKSRLRWLPQPRYSDAPFPEIKMIRFPSETRLLRSFPHANMVSQSEWTFYPNFGQPSTYHVGKRCKIDGTHHYRSLQSSSERTLEFMLGRKKQVKSYCSMAAGTTPCISPEYSADFYKYGSSLPTVGFGSSATLKGDTFIPLQGLTVPPGMTYPQKKQLNEREADIVEVRKLDDWRPAMPISVSLFDSRQAKHLKSDTLRKTLLGAKHHSSVLHRTMKEWWP
ncbi:spermatogenesis-associated serine-rich protein 1 [Megalops cyprinoides]|uniref:spermatogenesis-associated serine-rich protein 1 n=1 Tax=Megalops cyprinoides TaxID=118141 RepID=UPI00186525F3|nr:spermatogenesis-associated serine-rich protein 1 [Megalops cyprinoides]